MDVIIRAWRWDTPTSLTHLGTRRGGGPKTRCLFNAIPEVSPRQVFESGNLMNVLFCRKNPLCVAVLLIYA